MPGEFALKVHCSDKWSPKYFYFFGGHLAVKGLQVDTLCLPWSAATTMISTWYKLKLIESGVSHKLQFGYGSVGVRVSPSSELNFNSKENLWQVAKMSSSAPPSLSLSLSTIYSIRVVYAYSELSFAPNSNCNSQQHLLRSDEFGSKLRALLMRLLFFTLVGSSIRYSFYLL